MGEANARDIIVTLPSSDIGATESSYGVLLGLDDGEFSLDSVARYEGAPPTRARDRGAPLTQKQPRRGQLASLGRWTPR